MSLGLVGLLGVGATAATLGLLDYSRARTEAALRTEHVRVGVNQLAQLEWQAIADPDTAWLIRTEVADTRRGLEGDLAALDASPGLAQTQLRAMDAAMLAYLDALDTEFGLLLDGQLARAREVDQQRVDPQYLQLSGLLRAQSVALTEQAASATAASRVGLIILVPVSLTLAGVLGLRLTRVTQQSRSRARFEAMVAGASDVIVLTDPEGVIQYASPSLARVLGADPHTWQGTSLARWVHEDDRPRLRSALDALLAAPHTDQVLQTLVADQGREWRTIEHHVRNLTDDPLVRALVWNSRDVTERQQLQTELEHRAFHDTLTGLANRALLGDRLAQALARRAAGMHPPVVLLIDLDGFKDINDSLGHDAGDQVLTEIAARLTGCVRPADTVARLGGDEFAVLLEDLPDHQDVDHVASRLLQAIERPLRLAGRSRSISASIGVVIPAPGNGPADILRDADTAMYAAKTTGKARAITFEPAMHAEVQDRLELSADLLDAIHERAVQVHYQPIIDLDTGAVTAVEALARWQHPTRGWVPPGQFVALADDNGAFHELGVHVLRTACAQLHAWQLAHPDTAPTGVHVNLSPRQLLEPALLHDLPAVLRDTALRPAQLTLEVTEHALADDLPRAAHQLAALNELGVRLALDDFGAGYSSLSYLRTLPLDTLKIDSLLLRPTAAGDDLLLRAVTRLGVDLGLRTIAEGVQTPADDQRVRAAGCHLAQGFYYTPPVPASQITTHLRRAPRTTAQQTAAAAPPDGTGADSPTTRG